MAGSVSLYIWRRCALVVAIGAVLLGITGPAGAQTYLPSVKIGTAVLVSPTDAETYLRAIRHHAWTDGLATITGTATPEPTEIVELARALKNDPDNDLSVCPNNIQTVWLYGDAERRSRCVDRQVRHGVRSSSIDDRNFACGVSDQARTFLRAYYQAGTITLTGTQFAAWSNITSPQAACQLLSSGGIPAQITTDAGPLTDCTSSTGTSITSITMAHVWVAVSDLAGCSPCLFDPAYKPYTWKAGISNLAAQIGITAGVPLRQQRQL